MEKVSIIIPVFRESKKLENLFIELLKDKYPQKEIITVIDEPTDNSLILFKKYKNKIKFILNEKRIGKVKASNLAVRHSSGDILLFLDSDNFVNNSKGDLIQRIVDGMNGYDYAALKITANKKSIMSKMSYYDYIASAFVSFIFSKLLKRIPVICGAAFVIRKETFNKLGGFKPEIAEDFGLSIRAFLQNRKFAYLKNLEVVTGTPKNFGEWLKQRNRWVAGAALWLKKYWKPILKNTEIYPHLFLGSFFAVFPTILLFLINLLLSNSLLERIIYFIILLMPLKSPATLSLVFLIFSSITLIRSAILYLSAFLISCSITYFTAKLMKYRFSLKEYMLYYFFYAPLNFSIYLVNGIRYFISPPELKDWKV
jgi:cellulose synthase/poly-beta-1,6-N-acetylglucosamine synthase-like glycosyltransferase